MTFFLDLIRIACRSIQQRSVASLLTIFSMSLGVMLVVAVLTIHGVVDRSFRNNSSLGFNVIIGAKGGPEQLTLNTVYYLSRPVENISYDFYLEFLEQKRRDELLKESFRCQAHEAQAAAGQLEAAALVAGDPAATLAASALGAAVTKQDAQRIDLGRNGKYARQVQFAIPVCLGDYFDRFRVVGTTPEFFDNRVYDVNTGAKFEFAEGRNFVTRSKDHGYFEAVVGSTVAREMNVKLGDKINPAHGVPEGHTHARAFSVVGIVKPSGTPNDRAVFVNMEGFYLMEDHATPVEQLEPATAEPEQPKEPLDEEEFKRQFLERATKRKAVERVPDPPPLPAEQREVTAILVKTGSGSSIGLVGGINQGKDAQAVTPVQVIYNLFAIFVEPVRWILLALTLMICVVSGISILVSIYNSMSERRHEIAVMRALGAGRMTVLTIILLEATLLSLAGGFVGWLTGHVLAVAASPYVENTSGVRIGFHLWGEPFFQPLVLLGHDTQFAEWLSIPVEWLLIPALILLAIVVGLWPGVSAYRTDVAKSLGK